MNKMKPVVLTKRQLDNALVHLFNVEERVVPRTKMPSRLYDYAWTVWAKRQGKRLNQGKRAKSRAARGTEVKP